VEEILIIRLKSLEIQGTAVSGVWLKSGSTLILIERDGRVKPCLATRRVVDFVVAWVFVN